ncbi:hypothetical protein GF337_16870 [candidate division KSB1 bacterium]|nr:hypothetical protein [candidate division KSB1 bacterium]
MTLKSKISILFTFIILRPLSAQIIEPTFSPDDIARSIEANLTFDLQNELYSYYPENKIAIKANVRLYRPMPKPANPPLPSLPGDTELRMLPGLPKVPEKQSKTGNPNNARQMTQILQQYLQESGYRISRISINAMVDSSLNRDDIHFIRKLVTLRAGINPGRGDRVHIDVLKFPRKEKKMSDTPVLENQPLAAANKEPSKKSEIAQWIFMALALLMGAIIIYLIYRLRHQSTAAIRQKKPEVQQAVTPKPALSPKRHNQPSIPSVTEYLIGAPVASAKVLKNWIDDPESKGIEKTAILIKHISPGLIDMYESHLGTERCGKIRLVINNITRPVPKNILAEIYRKFDHDFKVLALSNTTSKNEEDLFSFIYQLTDDQLIHLMKNIEPGLAAIIIAQLQPERGAALIKKFEKNKQQQIFLSMSKIEKIPLKIYKRLAHRLAHKAQKVANMKYVTADAVDTTVDLLDHFDEGTQRDFINHLKCNDLKFAYRVHKKFIKFSDVINLPQSDLREVFRTADRDVIAASIVDLGEEDIERIISALPSKMGEMVRSSLNMKKFASESEIEEAKRRLVRTARNRSIKINKKSGFGKNIKGMPQIIMKD